jgi:hypothetical protein
MANPASPLGTSPPAGPGGATPGAPKPAKAAGAAAPNAGCGAPNVGAADAPATALAPALPNGSPPKRTPPPSPNAVGVALNGLPPAGGGTGAAGARPPPPKVNTLGAASVLGGGRDPGNAAANGLAPLEGAPNAGAVAGPPKAAKGGAGAVAAASNNVPDDAPNVDAKVGKDAAGAAPAAGNAPNTPGGAPAVVKAAAVMVPNVVPSAGAGGAAAGSAPVWAAAVAAVEAAAAARFARLSLAGAGFGNPNPVDAAPGVSTANPANGVVAPAVAAPKGRVDAGTSGLAAFPPNGGAKGATSATASSFFATSPKLKTGTAGPAVGSVGTGGTFANKPTDGNLATGVASSSSSTVPSLPRFACCGTWKGASGGF